MKLPTTKPLCVLVSYILTFLHGTSSQLQIDPKDPVVMPGQNLSVLCQSDHPLAICRIKVGGFKNALIFLNTSNTTSKEYAYYGNGLDNGQCGITLFNVNDMANGVLECSTLPHTGTNEETSAKTNITVIRRPKKPELVIQNLNSTKSSGFNESNILHASCSVQGGRPLANMTWYLDGKIITERIKSHINIDTSTDLRTITQTMEKTLSWRDNNKVLTCAAGHRAWSSEYETTQKLNVFYLPRRILLTKSIEVYGLKLNEKQNITVEMYSNPKPSFTWLIATKSKLVEGQRSTDGNLFAQWPEHLGEDKWQVVLQIKNLTKADVGKRYHLIAKNTIGQKTYEVLLSTDEQSALKLSIGTYILIISVSACLIMFGVILTVTITQRRKQKYLVKSESKSTEKITKLDVES